MENKKLKNPILNELDDDALDTVSGGSEYDLTGMFGYEQTEEAEKWDHNPNPYDK